MSQSLAKNLIHLIYSTKDRRPVLEDAVREELHQYSGGILRDQESPCLEIGSVADHVHLLFVLTKNKALADVVREVKKGTSRWLKTKGPQFAEFEWQAGYGAFSVSQSAVEEVRRYILNQAEHHQKVSFQDELRAFLRRYEIEFNERYVWD
jgi:REP element-mobilizing transposase RayT